LLKSLVVLGLLIKQLDLVQEARAPILVLMKLMSHLSQFLNALLVHFDGLLVTTEDKDTVVGIFQFLTDVSQLTLIPLILFLFLSLDLS